MTPPIKELIVLVADKSMKITVETLIAGRSDALGIRHLQPADYDVIAYQAHDSGVYLTGHEFLRTQRNRYRYGLLICDRYGCGQEERSREELEAQMEENLNQSGWGNGRAAAVVIDPELEVWVWTESPHVEDVLGWRGRQPALRDWMRSNGYLAEGRSKPAQPQDCLQGALATVNKARSPALFREIAQKVSLQRCNDGAFRKFVSTLKSWLPAEGGNKPA